MSLLHDIRLQHDVDPGEDLRARVGDLSQVHVQRNLVLAAIYRPSDKKEAKTKAGIILPDETTDEFTYLCTRAVVLAVGPTAFHDDANVSFGGEALTPGQWISYRHGDGVEIEIRGVRCITIRDDLIRLVAPSYDVVV